MNFLALLDETATDGATQGNSWTTWVIIGVLILAFVGMMFYSNYSRKKQQKQADDMNNALKIGDHVKSIGGIVGTIVGIDEENGNFEIQTGSTTMVIDRKAIYPISYFDSVNGTGGHRAAQTDAEPEAPAEPATPAPESEPAAEAEKPVEESAKEGDVAPEGKNKDQE